MCEEKNALCSERFEAIDCEVSGIRKTQQKQSQEIKELAILSARLNERLCSLTDAVKLLTRSLWGVALSAVSALISFFIWYIQTKG